VIEPIPAAFLYDDDAHVERLLGWDGWNDDRGQAYVLAGWDLPWEEAAWW
jgi:hypothetical protein